MKANIGWYWIYNDSRWHYFVNNNAVCKGYKRLAKTKYQAKPGDGAVCEECEAKA